MTTGTDYIGICKANYYMIAVRMALILPA